MVDSHQHAHNAPTLSHHHLQRGPTSRVAESDSLPVKMEEVGGGVKCGAVPRLIQNAETT